MLKFDQMSLPQSFQVYLPPMFFWIVNLFQYLNMPIKTLNKHSNINVIIIYFPWHWSPIDHVLPALVHEFFRFFKVIERLFSSRLSLVQLFTKMFYWFILVVSPIELLTWSRALLLHLFVENNQYRYFTLYDLRFSSKKTELLVLIPKNELI